MGFNRRSWRSRASFLILVASLSVPALAQTEALEFGPPGVISDGGTPAVACTEDGKIWAVWDEKDREIYYSVFNGTTWGPATKLTERLQSLDANPGVTSARDGTIWVVWGSGGMKPWLTRTIHYKVFDGTSWTDDMVLVEGYGVNASPGITQDKDGNMWVVWSSERVGNGAIFYKIFDGYSWSADTRLTLNSAREYDPAITCAEDGKIWVVFPSNRHERNYEDLYYKVYDGGSWSLTRRLTNRSGWDSEPGIASLIDGRIFVAWGAAAAAQDRWRVYYKVFDGQNWSEAIKLTEYYSGVPAATQAKDGTIWVLYNAEGKGVEYVVSGSTSSDF